MYFLYFPQGLWLEVKKGKKDLRFPNYTDQEYWLKTLG